MLPNTATLLLQINASNQPIKILAGAIQSAYRLGMLKATLASIRDGAITASRAAEICELSMQEYRILLRLHCMELED